MYKLLHAAAALSAFLVMSSAANAADMHVKAPAPAPMPPPFSWTGFYFGGNFGGAWVQRDVTDGVFGLNFGNGSNDGVFIGGGQLGFNYQVNTFVIGVEGDFDWAANNSNTSNGVIVPGVGLGHTFQVTANNRWVTTLAARFGFAVNQVLFFGKAGGGWVGADGFTVTDLSTGVSFTGSGSNTNSGWLVGAGFEWGFADNWSAKFEYDFLGLNSRTFTVPVGSPFFVGDTFTTGRRDVQMAKVGINYRFNWASPSPSPVTTKY
jgi:outer membrane immunogenic protein